MKNIRLKKVENNLPADTLPVSPEEHEANCDAVVEMLLNVAERLPKDAPPVKETMSELIAELGECRRNPAPYAKETIIQHADGRRIKYFADGSPPEILSDSGDTSLVAVPNPENDTLPALDALQPPDIGESVTDIAARVREKRFRVTTEKPSNQRY